MACSACSAHDRQGSRKNQPATSGLVVRLDVPLRARPCAELGRASSSAYRKFLKKKVFDHTYTHMYMFKCCSDAWQRTGRHPPTESRRRSLQHTTQECPPDLVRKIGGLSSLQAVERPDTKETRH